MRKAFNVEKILQIVLWLIGAHSFLVGLSLIILPSSIMVFFGFEANYHNFFRVQGGVFHIVLSIIYAVAAINIRKHQTLIKLSIITKFIATVFLISYYLFFIQILTILLSGIGDFLMGVVILLLFLRFKNAYR
ncbi:MAG: hypothetical protein K8S00_04615 [Bacteroidales bacterium]|nr:hypothetical protein [Bacteroidales bacterium]